MIGASQPASRRRFLISGNAAAASGMFTVARTSSEPAWASSRHCFVVAATSAVSVLVIDWTTTGAPPPTWIFPTLTPTVLWRFWGIWNIVANWGTRALVGAGGSWSASEQEKGRAVRRP